MRLSAAAAPLALPVGDPNLNLEVGSSDERGERSECHRLEAAAAGGALQTMLWLHDELGTPLTADTSCRAAGGASHSN